jgi:hypothetical protein
LLQAVSISIAILVAAPVAAVPGSLVLFALPISLYMVSRSEEPGKWLPLVPMVVLVSFLVWLGANAYLVPAPLPTAHLQLKAGHEPSGVFLTHTDSTWYIFEKKSETIRAFSDESTLQAEIEEATGSDIDRNSLLEYAWEAL